MPPSTGNPIADHVIQLAQENLRMPTVQFDHEGLGKQVIENTLARLGPRSISDMTRDEHHSVKLPSSRRYIGPNRDANSRPKLVSGIRHLSNETVTSRLSQAQAFDLSNSQSVRDRVRPIELGSESGQLVSERIAASALVEDEPIEFVQARFGTGAKSVFELRAKAKLENPTRNVDNYIIHGTYEDALVDIQGISVVDLKANPQTGVYVGVTKEGWTIVLYPIADSTGGPTISVQDPTGQRKTPKFRYISYSG